VNDPRQTRSVGGGGGGARGPRGVLARHGADLMTLRRHELLAVSYHKLCRVRGHPRAGSRLTSARSSTSTAAECPLVWATWSGVAPCCAQLQGHKDAQSSRLRHDHTLLRRSNCAPSLSSSATVAARPSHAASCRAVSPCCDREQQRGATGAVRRGGGRPRRHCHAHGRGRRAGRGAAPARSP
jgi:hypothetical protein